MCPRHRPEKSSVATLLPKSQYLVASSPGAKLGVPASANSRRYMAAAAFALQIVQVLAVVAMRHSTSGPTRPPQSTCSCRPCPCLYLSRLYPPCRLCPCPCPSRRTCLHPWTCSSSRCGPFLRSSRTPARRDCLLLQEATHSLGRSALVHDTHSTPARPCLCLCL